MNKSFYVFMARYRDDKKNPTLQKLAREMFNDHGFPNHSKDYSEVSNYMEMSGQYDTPLTVFDEAWVLYEGH